jgi:DnaJ domain
VRRKHRSTVDPFAVLGVPRSADADALRSARRRLALDLHPDRGGSADRMQAINVAFEEAMGLLAGAATEAPSDPPPPPAAEAPAPSPRSGGRRSVERDEPSFVIEVLPAEAFEALLVVANWMGEVMVDDPPYLLEARLYEPDECWCRLELLAEAGATTVMLTVAGVEGEAPSVEAVRDAWIAHLNQLGRASD